MHIRNIEGSNLNYQGEKNSPNKKVSFRLGVRIELGLRPIVVYTHYIYIVYVYTTIECGTLINELNVQCSISCKPNMLSPHTHHQCIRGVISF